MSDFLSFVSKCITYFFTGFFSDIIEYFGKTLSDVMGTSTNVLDLTIVKNTVKYAQLLALALLVLKTINEAFQTYIMYQSGDPDADPSGLLIRTGQAIAVILTLPFIVEQTYTFGTKLSKDIANVNPGQSSGASMGYIKSQVSSSSGALIPVFFIVIVVLILIVAIQATIRGAELALMSVLGPIMALNITANNRSVWSAWFRQLVIICCSQAVQIFMLDGVLSLFLKPFDGIGALAIFGWLWVTIKTPKYIQQFVYSSGLTGTIGGTAKQAGSMALMRRFMSASG